MNVTGTMDSILMLLLDARKGAESAVALAGKDMKEREDASKRHKAYTSALMAVASHADEMEDIFKQCSVEIELE